MNQTLPIDLVPTHGDFRALGSVPGISVDLRYAGPNNFVGSDLYAPFDCAWIHRHGAERLEAAAQWLRERGEGRSLRVLDALRPQRVQQRLWDTLPPDLRMYLANPERGSIHSFGMAVDITLLDPSGRELDMGTGFDDMTELSHPALEARHLAGGLLDAVQIANRQLLREAMFQAGFVGINSEWWHFDCGDRVLVRRDYTRVL